MLLWRLPILVFHSPELLILYIIKVLVTVKFLECVADASNRKEVSLPNHVQKFENTLIWAIKLQAEKNDVQKEFIELAESLESKHDLLLLGPIGELSGHYLFGFRPKTVDEDELESVRSVSFERLHRLHKRSVKEVDQEELVQRVTAALERDVAVEWFSRQKVLPREKRRVKERFHDPYYRKQWHLENYLNPQMDTNITGVWERNITGYGVTVAVVDDGLEWTNPDIEDNYSSEGSWDLNAGDPDPMPSETLVSNHHGTRCAGEIAAVANAVCGVGMAYHAKVSGLRVLDGPMTDSLEAAAFNMKMQVNDIYSCSWGPDDDGKTVDGPHRLATEAMRYGIDFGRHGYGSIFVVASGNGGVHGDNCNYDGYANSIYTVTIGAVDETGHMPYYAEECASMLTVTFSSGQNHRSIVTTDWTKHGGRGCTENHSGTSAAAPIAAGMIALMLQVRPCLTWRDVQYLIILTAQKVDIDVAHWQKNGAGLYHSHKHGFGLMKAWRVVNAAKVWENVPWMTSFTVRRHDLNIRIPKGREHPLELLYTVTEKEIQGYSLLVMEHVLVTLTISHPSRGFLDIRLQSPRGTESIIGASRPQDNSTAGFDQWTFSTVRCWGETPTGKWKIIIVDTDESLYEDGYVQYWKLQIFGTPMSPEELRRRRRRIEEAMSGEFLDGNFSLPCPPAPVKSHLDIPVSEKTLKVFLLAGAFCLIMALYETFEYAACYGEEKKERQEIIRLGFRARQLASGGEVYPTETAPLLDNEEIPMQTFSAVRSLRDEDLTETRPLLEDTDRLIPDSDGTSEMFGGGLGKERAHSSQINISDVQNCDSSAGTDPSPRQLTLENFDSSSADENSHLIEFDALRNPNLDEMSPEILSNPKSSYNGNTHCDSSILTSN